MPNIKGLLADPEFNKLPMQQQMHVLGQVDPQFSQLNEEQFRQFRTAAQPSKEELVSPPERNWFDRIQQGFTGGLMNPSAHEDPLTRIVGGVKGSLDRTTKAWGDALTGKPGPFTGAEMVPLLGPAAVDATQMLLNPETRLEGAGAVGAILAGAREGFPTIPETTKMVEVPLGPGLKTPAGPPRLPEIPSGVKTAAEWALPVPIKLQKVISKGYDLLRENSGSPARTTEQRRVSVNFPDTRISPPPGMEGERPDLLPLEFRAAKSPTEGVPAASTPIKTGAAKPVIVAPPPPLASDLEKSGQVIQQQAPSAQTAPATAAAPAPAFASGQTPVRHHETNLKVDRQITNKVNNLAEYLRSKGGDTTHLDQILEDPKLTRQYLDEAREYGAEKGNPVPKGPYKGLDKGSDSHKAVRERILQLIEEEKGKK